jgi:hypothetical protein
MSGLGAFGELATCGGPPGGDPADEAWRTFLLDGAARGRLLVEVNAAELGGALATMADGDGWGMVATCEAAGPPFTLGQTDFLFGDGVWIGRPSDALKPNAMADARIMASADIDRTLPLAPEAARRGEISVGQIQLANADGGLDSIVGGYSIGGRSVRLRYGPARGDFGAFALILDAFAQGWESTHQSVQLRLLSTASFLSTPLQPRSYPGTGGSDGDPTLTGRAIPSLWGQCFNITPVLLNRDQWVYQVHDGPIYAIDAVKERGLPFIADGDVPDYATLRLTPVAGGHYRTCLALGLVKLGLGVAGPAGPITMDVRGDASSGGYVDTTGEILLRMALGRARIDGGLVNRESFLALPRGRIGYYADGANQLLVSSAFDELLRAVSAYYGTSRGAALCANAPRAPTEVSSRRLDLDRNSILDLEDVGVQQPPRWSQGATYGRNWTPMSASDVSEALDSATRQRLQTAALSVRRLAGEVQQRDRSAIEGGTIETFFVEESPADELCAAILTLFRETRRRFRVSVPRTGYIVDLNQTVRVTYPRFGFEAGRNFLVVGVRDKGAQGLIDLTVWG